MSNATNILLAKLKSVKLFKEKNIDNNSLFDFVQQQENINDSFDEFQYKLNLVNNKIFEWEHNLSPKDYKRLIAEFKIIDKEVTVFSTKLHNIVKNISVESFDCELENFCLWTALYQMNKDLSDVVNFYAPLNDNKIRQYF